MEISIDTDIGMVQMKDPNNFLYSLFSLVI